MAGSALAAVLARDGRRVTIIDKSKDPREIIAGQSLMGGGVLAFKELGVESGYYNFKVYMKMLSVALSAYNFDII